MLIKAGDLRHRATLLGKVAPSKSAFSGNEPEVLGTVFASVRKTRGGFVNVQTQEITIARMSVAIRYSPKYSAVDSIVYNGTKYRVTDITNHNEQNRWLIFDVTTDES